MREFPGSVRRELADATDPAMAARLIDRIAGGVGPPGVLVNTVGAFRPGDALTATLETLGLMRAHAIAPEAIAGVIAFLVSDSAAPVSGAILQAYGA